jgi:cell division protein FtsA
MAKDYKDLVVGLDIGTSKVMVVVAEVMPGGEPKLAGLVLHRAMGSSVVW